jgi:MoaA/NifB/PqqE/SkfB family radical SAM enzyme
MNPIAIKSNQPNNFVKISYSPTDRCNYKCRYCFPGSNAGKYSWPTDLDLVTDNFSHLFEYYQQNGKDRIELQILGGEPTVWPDLAVFIARLKEKYNFIVSIQSNGSRTHRWWQENAVHFDKVNLSAHHQQIDLQHFTEVADILYSAGVYVDVSVCMDPLAWDRCYDMIEYFKKHSKNRWYIGTQKIEESDRAKLYTTEQLDFLTNSTQRYPNIWYAIQQRSKFNINRSRIYFDNGSNKKVKHNQVQINDWNHFYGWECNVGVDMFYINPLGEMSGSCGQSLYNMDTKYNIYDQDFRTTFNPKLQPTVCKLQGCYCTPETLLTKTLVNGISAAQVHQSRVHTIGSLGTLKVLS